MNKRAADLVQKYIGAETVDAFSTDDNELLHRQESDQTQKS